jgi:excinuclease UvrABC nuclease subunit
LPFNLPKRGDSILNWSKWRRLNKSNWKIIPENPGVYYIRYVNKSDRPVNILRLGGVDKDGIIYIGETGRNLRNRLRNFWRWTGSGNRSKALIH